MATTPKLMAVQFAAIAVGAGLVLIGILGFIPGITSNYSELQWAGQHSGAQLFGLFAVSGLHNVVHLALGAAGLMAARTYAASRAYLLAGGLAVLVLWLWAAVVDLGGVTHYFPLNGADNWLHFGVGVVMMLLGVTLGGQHDPTKRPKRRFRAAHST